MIFDLNISQANCCYILKNLWKSNSSQFNHFCFQLQFHIGKVAASVSNPIRLLGESNLTLLDDKWMEFVFIYREVTVKSQHTKGPP
uniref:Uncharacterized protein n=1 Tax=Tetranychus urticae TaxID=32264 RepID=T1JSE4_TETUR